MKRTSKALTFLLLDNPIRVFWTPLHYGESPQITSRGHPMETQKSFMCGPML
jgi:hypothetical protein